MLAQSSDPPFTLSAPAEVVSLRSVVEVACCSIMHLRPQLSPPPSRLLGWRTGKEGTLASCTAHPAPNSDCLGLLGVLNVLLISTVCLPLQLLHRCFCLRLLRLGSVCVFAHLPQLCAHPQHSVSAGGLAARRMCTRLPRTLLHHLCVLCAPLVNSLRRWIVLQPYFAVLAPTNTLSTLCQSQGAKSSSITQSLPEHLLGHPFLQQQAHRSGQRCTMQLSGT